MTQVQWVRFNPYVLTADRWWRRAAPAERGIYWSLMTDLYTADGRLAWDADEIAAVCNCWADGRPDAAAVEAVVAAAGFERDADETGQVWLRHPAVTAELERTHQVRRARADGGRRGGRPRKTDADETAGAEADDDPAYDSDDDNLKVLGGETLRLSKKTQERGEERRGDKIREIRERRGEGCGDGHGLGRTTAMGNGSGRFFRFVQAVQAELRVHGKSDVTTIRHVGEYLMAKEQDGTAAEGQSLLLGAWERAREVRGADKPIAVWVNRIKDEYGWQPQRRRKG